jgi:flagellar biosynthesis protein FlhF
MTFGDGTLILSNRATASGVEVVATAEETLAALDREEEAPRRTKNPPTLRQQQLVRVSRQPAADDPVAQDTEQLAMSTLSFQDYVRERMLRRRQDAIDNQGATAPPTSPTPPPPATTAPLAQNAAATRSPARKPMTPAADASGQQLTHEIALELQAMKAMIDDRFNTLTWLGQSRQDPIQSNLMLKLIRAGYSPMLARAILEKMPEHADAAESMRWVIEVLERNVRTDAGARAVHEEGGIFALVGATGVGKTTTAAKLAGLCVRTHGPGSVGLITLDTYRVGAHEQLRAYGRMLGVVAHLAHDRAALQDLMNLLGGKKMVLIDTTGLAPRDPRKRDMLDVLDLPRINRLLVLNAGSQGDSLDDAIGSFKTAAAPQAILSKIDEAVKMGPALDAVVRHQLTLRGVTTGQKVPEDWERADAAKLVRLSLRNTGKSAYDPTVPDLGFFFASPGSRSASRSALDA